MNGRHDPRLLEAFQLMWGNFPDPMILVHRDRTILAMNAAAATSGTLGALGGKCFQANPQSGGHACQGCQANAALAACAAMTCEGEFFGKRIRGYWIPLQGASDLFIHGYSPLGPPLAVVA